MGNGFRLKKKHWFYNPNVKRKKTAKKYQKTLEWLLLIAKKSQKDYMAKWAQATLPKAMARVKKYGIPRERIEEFFAQKNSKTLLKKIFN